MTVAAIRDGRVLCHWFTGDKRETASFEPTALMKVPPEETKVERGLGFGRDPL